MNTGYRIERFEKLAPRELLTAIQEAACNFEQAQAEALADILRYGADSEYGRNYHFTELYGMADCVEAFRKTVPVTDYSDYKEQIKRMENGEEDVLFPGRTPVFLNTSGTTGIPKNIPESDKGGVVKKLVSAARMMRVAAADPKIMDPEYKVFAIMNKAFYGTTRGGIPIASASGQSSRAGGSQGGSASMLLPIEVLSAPGLSAESFDYLTMLYGLASDKICALFCNNVAHFHKLLEKLNKEPKRYIEDIRQGTVSAKLPKDLGKWLEEKRKPDPARADQLEGLLNEKGMLEVKDIWPEFDFVCCWLSASVGRTAREFGCLFPDGTRYFDWGYGASEGKFNIPMKTGQPGGLLVTFGYFYEFLPVGEKETVLLKDTEDGGRYELVVTTYSGFYRYNIHDIVEITINEDGSRNIEFVCKSADRVEIAGKTLYACELSDMIERYEQEKSVKIRLFQGKPEGDGLHLLIEPAGELDRDGFEAYVHQGFQCLGVPLAGVAYKEEGYRDSLFTRNLENGKTINQTKLPVFV